MALALGGLISTAAAAAAPLVLTPADVSLYLMQMRAAASRIKHPTDADRAARLRAEQATERQAAAYRDFSARFQGTTKPTAADVAALKASDLSPADIEARYHTQALKRRPDVVIAMERHLDLRHYLAVRETIERLVVIDNEAREHDADRDADHDDARLRDADDDHDHDHDHDRHDPPVRLTGIDGRNAALLRPHLPEIRRLLDITLQGGTLDTD